MHLIVAVSSNWGIGKDGGMLFSLPEDMKYFKEMTLGKTVVMGRKTLESIPGGQPLKDRTNLVLTRDTTFQKDGFIVCHTPKEVLELTKALPEQDVMIIGGEEIYRLFLPLCRKAWITKVDTDTPDAERFFPDLDRDPEWKMTACSETLEQNGHSFRFCQYERIIYC